MPEYFMPYIERLLSHEVLLQPVPAPPNFYRCYGQLHVTLVIVISPRLSLNLPLRRKLGFHYNLETLSTILAELSFTNISVSDNLPTHPPEYSHLETHEGTQAREIIYSHIPLPSLSAAKVVLTAFFMPPLLNMEYLIEHEIYESVGVIGPLLPLSSVPVLPDDVGFSDCTQSLFPGDDHITDDFGHSLFALAGCEVLEHVTIAGVYGRRDPWDRRSLGPLPPQEQLNYRPEYTLLTLFGMPCMD